MADSRILFVDDDPDILELVEQYLARKGYDVTTTDNGMSAVRIVQEKQIDIVFTDYRMPAFTGLELLVAIKKCRPQTEVIIVTGYGTLESAIQAMKFGGYDYLQKPFELNHLQLLIDRITEERKIRDKNLRIHGTSRNRCQYGEMVGMGPKMREVYDLMDAIYTDSSTVLIQGERGTGKKLAARTLHENSDRKNRPFVVLDSADTENEGRLPEILFAAAGGTLYLNEVSGLAPGMWERMAMMLEQWTADAPRPRLIAGTTGELNDIIASGMMKKNTLDLFNAIFIRLPALRERKEDIPLLVNHFLFNPPPTATSRIYGTTPLALTLLIQYHWPENITQLRRLMEQMAAMKIQNVIEATHLPEEIQFFQMDTRTER